jgi:uncharacterized protein YjiS (DUF1127 family)
MTVIHWHGTRNHHRRNNAIVALNDAANHVVGTLGEWRRRTRGRAELAALDDRMLKDIGLTRTDADFLSNKPFWRE